MNDNVIFQIGPPNQRKGQKKPEDAKSNSPNPQQPKKGNFTKIRNGRCF